MGRTGQELLAPGAAPARSGFVAPAAGPVVASFVVMPVGLFVVRLVLVVVISIAALPFVAQQRLAREFDLVALFADALDHDLLPLFEFVAHVADAMIGDLGDVQEAISARKDFDERAEINDARDRADVGRADLGLGRQTAYALDGQLRRFAVGGRNRDRAVVFDVNLRAGLFDERAGDLAARPGDVAYLVRVDLYLGDARRIWREGE